MPKEALKGARLLIVDDEPANVRLLERLLEQDGYTNVTGTTDSRRAVPLYQELQPDLLLLDLLMPDPDGFAVLEQLQPLIPEGTYSPILVLTADITAETRRRALAMGAKDFVIKPFDAIEVLLRIRNLLETRCLHRELQNENVGLEQTVRERTAQLLQTEKVATMGQLLAGVAHELNNPLTVVVGQAALLGQAAGDGPLAARADKIAKAAERCSRIVKNFLALARQQPMERQSASLNQIAQEAVELLAYPLRVDSVEVSLVLDPALPKIWVDLHQLYQVVVNLVSNAHQAMRTTPPPRRVRLSTRLDPGKARVQLEVADTGPGIPRAIQARIFEPFFTTKPPGQGTGLGLSLCRGIVEAHGGSIRLESEPNRGAVFLIDLPIDLRREPRVEGAEAATPGLPIRGQRVLLVDDDPDVAEMLADLLRLDDHQVEMVGNGRLALDRLRERTYDLILSDIKMPELDGPDFYRALTRQHPTLTRRVIFLTGDSVSPETHAFLQETAVPSLSKPFLPREVRRVIGRLLRPSTPEYDPGR